MKVLVFTDFHNDYGLLPQLTKKAAEADVVVCAGDPTIFEHDLQGVLHSFNAWGKPVLMIHGNHENEESLRKACMRHKHILFVHGKETVINGVRFLCWGGGGFSLTDRGLERQLDSWKRSEQPTILVTHAPPYKTTLDDIGRPVGCRSVRKAIERLKPRYAISGHIHETAGAQDVIGETRLLNPGPEGRLIRV